MISRFSSIARLAWAIIFVFAALLVPMSANAQELRGKISGRVTDANGGAVAGASVKVTDLAKGAVAEFTTNADGLFVRASIYHPQGKDAKGLPDAEKTVSLIVQQHRLPLTSNRNLVPRDIFHSDLPVYKDLKPSTKLRLSFGPGRSPSCRQNRWRAPRIDCKTR